MLNNTFVEGCASNFSGTIPIGGYVKILWMTCRFCIEPETYFREKEFSMQNPWLIWGIFTAAPLGIALLKLNT